tara:strand:+ start:373 stop:708 length:336 start_codon:yes stop_codon:yes gene_type:complete
MNVLYTILIFLVCNILIWYQLNSQLVWEWAKGMKSMWIMALLGIPISLLFWWATKIGYDGLGSLWKIRLLGFGVSMLIFPVMTYFYLGETMTIKTILSLGLAITIMLLQLI